MTCRTPRHGGPEPDATTAGRWIPARARAFCAELAGFACVGVFAFGADIGSFLWLRGPVGIDPMAAKALSFVAGAAVAYAGNALGPYRLRDRKVAGSLRRFSVFVLVNAAGGVVQLGCLGVSRYGLGLTSTLADVVSGGGVGLVLGTAVRFWGTRTLVFSTVPDPHQAPPPAPQGGAPLPDAVPEGGRGWAGEGRAISRRRP